MKYMKLTLWAAGIVSGLPLLGFAGDPPATLPDRPGAVNGPIQLRIHENGIGGQDGDDVFIADGEEGPNRLNPGMPHVRAFALRVPGEKGAYLGVGASPAAPVLQKQLDLPEGMGLVVDVVVPDGPAAASGLKPYDVLQKLDDQLLVNPQQLAVLVRSHKPGDEIKLTLIRQGKPQVITAKLIEHELEPLVEIERMQDEVADQMRHMLPEPGVHPILPGTGPFQLRIREGGRPGGAASFTLMDADRSYSVSIDIAGHKTFTVKDKDGKNLFDGLIDTPDQRAKLPDDLKAKLDHMEQMMPQNAKTHPEPIRSEEKK